MIELVFPNNKLYKFFLRTYKIYIQYFKMYGKNINLFYKKKHLYLACYRMANWSFLLYSVCQKNYITSKHFLKMF